MGKSIHAGQVVVADGTPQAGERVRRVLTADPGLGVVRHADAGYPEALAVARSSGLKHADARSRARLGVACGAGARAGRARAHAGRRGPDPAPAACRAAVAARRGRRGADADGGDLGLADGLIAAETATRGAAQLDVTGCALVPGFVDCHTHLPFAGWRAGEYAQKLAGVPYAEIARGGGGIRASARALARASDEQVLEQAVGSGRRDARRRDDHL